MITQWLPGDIEAYPRSPLDKEYPIIEEELMKNREYITAGTYAQRIGLDREQSTKYLGVLKKLANNFHAAYPTGTIDKRTLSKADIIKEFAFKRSEALPEEVLNLRKAKIIIQEK